MDPSTPQEIPVLEVTGIRRRKDGVFLIDSNGEVALSLSARQMMIVLAVAHAEYGDNIRRELRELVFPNRPRMRLKYPARQGDTSAIPMSPGERSSLSRTLHRLENLGLLEIDGAQDIEPTESSLAISDWVDDHPEVAREDDLLSWTKDT